MLQGGKRGAGFNTAEDVEPLDAAVVDVRHVGQSGHGLDGEIKVGGSAGEAVPVEAFGSDSGKDNGLGVYPERGADDGGITVIAVLPEVVTHHGDGSRAGDII